MPDVSPRKDIEKINHDIKKIKIPDSDNRNLIYNIFHIHHKSLEKNQKQ